MYIVYFKLGKEPCVKHFNDRKQALEFGTMCKERQNDEVKVLHMDPTNPNPIVITLDKALDRAGITRADEIGLSKYATGETKAGDPLIMPANEDELYIIEQKRAQPYIDDELGIFKQIPRNEYELILEEALTKIYSLVKGLAEQLKRLTN